MLKKYSVRQSEQIKKQKAEIENYIMKGDYIILGKLLEVAPDTARMQFKRCKQNAVIGMQKIIDNRTKFIQNNKIQ